MLRLLAPAVVFASSAVCAQTPDAAAPASIPPSLTVAEDGFRFDANLDAWFPRLVGDVALVPGGGNANVEDLDLNGSETVFSGMGRVTFDRWFVAASGFTFDTDGTTPTLATSANWWSISLDVGYGLWTPLDAKAFPWSDSAPRADNVAGDGSQRVSLAFAPTIGITYDDIDVSATEIATGLSNGVDGSWLGTRFGVAAALALHTKDLVGFIDRIDFGVSGSFGPSFGVSGDGDGVGTLWAIDAGVRVLFTPNIGAHLGYKLVDGDFEDERAGTSNTNDLGLQGLVAGLAIEF